MESCNTKAFVSENSLEHLMDLLDMNIDSRDGFAYSWHAGLNEEDKGQKS